MGAFLGPDQCRNDVISGTEARQADVRFGSLGDIKSRFGNVRFVPESRHPQHGHSCLLSAKSGLLPKFWAVFPLVEKVRRWEQVFATLSADGSDVLLFRQSYNLQ